MGFMICGVSDLNKRTIRAMHVDLTQRSAELTRFSLCILRSLDLVYHRGVLRSLGNARHRIQPEELKHNSSHRKIRASRATLRYDQNHRYRSVQLRN